MPHAECETGYLDVEGRNYENNLVFFNDIEQGCPFSLFKVVEPEYLPHV